MTSYSIAEANSKLAQIVREAESGKPVRLIRRGTPVAIVLSLTEYERLTRSPQDFWSAYLKWRSEVDWSQITNDEIEQVFKDVRDRSPGRDFKLRNDPIFA